MWSVSMSMHD